MCWLLPPLALLCVCALGSRPPSLPPSCTRSVLPKHAHCTVLGRWPMHSNVQHPPHGVDQKHEKVGEISLPNAILWDTAAPHTHTRAHTAQTHNTQHTAQRNSVALLASEHTSHATTRTRTRKYREQGTSHSPKGMVCEFTRYHAALGCLQLALLRCDSASMRIEIACHASTCVHTMQCRSGRLIKLMHTGSLYINKRAVVVHIFDAAHTDVTMVGSQWPVIKS